MLVKIAELMEQTSDATIFAALKCALIEACRSIESKFALPEAKSPPMFEDEVDLGLNLGKVKAVVAYKNRTQLSLMDAKKAVEYHFDRMGYKFK